MTELIFNLVDPKAEASVRTLNGVVSGLMCEALETVEVNDTGLILSFGNTDQLDKYVCMLMVQHQMSGAKAPILLMSYLAQGSGEIQIGASDGEDSISLTDYSIVYDAEREYSIFDTDLVFHIEGTVGKPNVTDAEADNVRRLIVAAVQAKDDEGLTTLLTRSKEKVKTKAPKVKTLDKAKAKAKRKMAKESKRKNRG